VRVPEILTKPNTDPVRRLRLLPLLLLVLLTGLPVLRASNAFNQSIRLRNGNNDVVAILEVESCISQLPMRGYMPFRVTATNRSSRELKLNFSFNANWNWQEPASSSQFQMTLAPLGEEQADWLIPLYTLRENHYYSPSLELEVDSSVTMTETNNLLSHSSHHHHGYLPRFSLISQSIWGDLPADQVQNMSNGSSNILGAAISLPNLPADPRALSGVDSIILNQKEWEQLPSGTRYTLTQWVAQGGWLHLIDRKEEDQRLGLGELKTLSLSSKTLPQILASLPTVPSARLRVLAEGDDLSRRSWSLRQDLKEITRPAFLLFIMVVLVAGVLGPLNLWLAFKKKDVTRLLWCTPLLSFGFSIFLLLFILLSDGIGAEGSRSLRVLLLPDQNLEVLFQDQIVRSGVLLNNRFRTEAGVQVQDLNLEESQNYSDNSLTFHNLDREQRWSGDWFRSRSLQAQTLQLSRPGRARLERLPGEGAPRFRSRIDAELTSILYQDSDGSWWTWTGSLGPGAEAELTPMKGREGGRAFRNLRERDTDLFAPLIRGRQSPPGWFFASGTPADELQLSSLAGVKWQDRDVIWFGPASEGVSP